MYKFRVATENDFEDICKLIKSKEELFFVYPGGKYPLTVNQVRTLHQARKELTIVAEGNEVIGFANLYNYKPRTSAFIGNIVIDRSRRGRGLGKELVSYMIKLAYEKHHLEEVRISVFNENAQALLLYSGLGFTPYGIEERKNLKGNRVALIHMKKLRRKSGL